MNRPNRFYRPFDFECLPGRRPDDYRNAFQVDRDRIIYSSAFRRLQSKTQVFVSGEFDYVSVLQTFFYLYFLYGIIQ